MKQNKHIIIFAALLIFLSSCGSLSISKKRYSRGFNIDWFSSKDDVAKAPVKKEKNKPETTKADGDENIVKGESGVDAATDLNTPEAEATVVNADNVPVIESKVEKKEPKKKIAGGLIKKSKEVFQIQKKAISKLSHKNQSNSSSESNDSDVGLLILVILAIFIAPLAVYLYFGELNGHFWLSLIFYLVGIGAFGLFQFGIGVAIIHALLVVFGIFG